MSPEQTIFNKMYDICIGLGYDTYEYKPMDEVDYPFVFLGEQFSENVRVHKDFYNKDNQISVHIFHNSPYARFEVNQMKHQIEKAIIEEFGIDGEDITYRLLGEPNDADLLHGIIEPNIRI